MLCQMFTEWRNGRYWGFSSKFVNRHDMTLQIGHQNLSFSVDSKRLRKNS